jgi:Secretion system C-terminal sorting domain
MKKLYTLLFVAFAATMNAQTFAEWNFDDLVPATAMLPTTGEGTFSIIGGVEDSLTAGLMPAGNPSTGKAYSIKTFPATLTASGTAGYEFAVPTGAFLDPIYVTFDPRGSNTSSRWQQYEYSLDGGASWNVLGDNGGLLTNTFTANPMVRLNLPAGCGNNDGFRFRIVSIFDPGTGDYSAVNYAGTPPSTYGTTGGTWRIDNVAFGQGTLAVQENEIAGLQVYPNPVTNGILNISTDNNDAKTVILFDVLGKQVINTIVTDQPVNVASLNRGVYFVKVTEAGKTVTRKLVIK